MNVNADIYKCEDGSILIELFLPNKRIGIWVDTDDAGWYTVSKEYIPEFNGCGGLKISDDLKSRLDWLLSQNGKDGELRLSVE